MGFGVQSQTDSHHILRGLRHLLTMTKQLSKVSLSQFLVLCRFIQHRWKTILLSKGGKTGKRSWHKSERMKNKKKKKTKQWRLARKRKKTGRPDGKEKELKEENKEVWERERESPVYEIFSRTVFTVHLVFGGAAAAARQWFNKVSGFSIFLILRTSKS